MKEELTVVELTVEERERLLLDAVVTLVKSLREERQRLILRLVEIDEQLNSLAARADARVP